MIYDYRLMNNPFDYTPDPRCREAFMQLLERLDRLKDSNDIEDRSFYRELESGKMLGILIAEDAAGVQYTMYAFSGQAGAGGFHRDGFVEPVFDYLIPGGYFKTHEAKIMEQSIEIDRYERNELCWAEREYEAERRVCDGIINDFKERCRVAKSERAARRATGNVDEAENAAMIRSSQFEKAELHRLKKQLEMKLESCLTRLDEARARLCELKDKRRADSEALQQWLFDNFILLNARGEHRSLSEIFAVTDSKIPSSGAGECCAPKLLQAAFKRGLKPCAIAEYWFGQAKDGEVRMHGEHYAACRGKCWPILSWMLDGLDIEPPLCGSLNRSVTDEPEILYENNYFCVVDKPCGMLSVPGKGGNGSLQEWLEKKYGVDRDIRLVHRLDQDTSGVMIAAIGKTVYKELQRLFSLRKMKKTYIAVLDGDFETEGRAVNGCLRLPLSPDLFDRPRQRVDLSAGKEAVTDYTFLKVENGCSRVMFRPLTGRTHQLRVHAAAVAGLGMPIMGDRLYGRKGDRDVSRLLLHAHRIEFKFPDSDEGTNYSFESPVPF